MRSTPFIIVFVVAGAVLVLATFAATGAAISMLAQSGTIAGNASLVTNSTAIGGKAVKFGTGSSSTPTPTSISTPTPTPTGGGSSSLPYASALSSYSVLSQSYTASQMTSGNWAQNANNTQEGGGSCPTSNTTYDAANDAVKLSTRGTAASAGSNTDCGHIRSASLISTNGTVVESKVWLPGSGSTLIDWASYWTDGTNWPATGELDAIETQYGQSYVTYHYGSSSSPQSIGTASWDNPKLSSTPANDAVPGWNVVDMEFKANYAGANVYINGKLYASVPASVLAHNSQYINWGISGPNADDPNHASWPAGAGYEEVQYLRVFTP
ncbi:MAG TPA: hypothetical protein VGH44_06450 [Candidatus Saccharimonadia bacterium]